MVNKTAREGEPVSAISRTRTNSTGVLSPMDLPADTRVAGYALGTMLIEARLRGLVMTRDEIDTARGCQPCHG